MDIARRIARTAAVVLSVASLAPLAAGGTASAYGGDPDGVTTTKTDTRMLNCADTADPGCTASAMSVPAGTRIRVRCVRHGQAVGPTTLWLFVSTAGGNEGFIPAVRVSGDYTRYVASGHPAPKCDEFPRIRALEWAAHRFGEVTASVSGSFGTKDDWSGQCIIFAQSAYELTSSLMIPRGNAGPVGLQYRSRINQGTTDIPAGALVFWTGGSGDYGHVAVSLGRGGLVIGTSGSEGEEEPIRVYRANESGWGDYLGWVLPAGAGA